MLRLLIKLALLLALPAVAAAQEADRLRPLAEQGNAAAQYTLGTLYANGEGGVGVDHRQAAQWFERAAGRGHAEARRHLMFMRQLGLAEGAAPAGDALFRIQVATVPAEPDAAREWRRLQRRHPDALASLEMTAVVFETPEGGRIYRLQAGPLDEEAARAVCLRLREEGSTCLVIRP